MRLWKILYKVTRQQWNSIQFPKKIIVESLVVICSLLKNMKKWQVYHSSSNDKFMCEDGVKRKDSLYIKIHWCLKIRGCWYIKLNIEYGKWKQGSGKDYKNNDQ